MVRVNFEVIYYKQPRSTDPITESHRHSEEWGQTDFYCLYCGMRGVWQSAFEDIEAGPTLMCATCCMTYSFNYVRQAREHSQLVNNQDWQRLCWLRKYLEQQHERKCDGN
jgi:transcription elongation factor Elf1